VRVLVTGATGFTGGHLARHLVAGGQVGRALVREPARATALVADGIELVQGDLADPASLRPALTGIDIVHNVAALYRQAGLPRDAYARVNAAAVGALVDAAAKSGVRRVVHCSTVGVHGDVEHPPADEDAPFRPGDVYQETKVEGERLGRQAAARAGVELTIVRPSGIYGPGDRRLLKLFKGVARRRFVVLGDGEIFYHLTYVEDLVEGMRLAGEVAEGANRDYILAGGEVTTLNELCTRIARAAGVAPPRLHLPVWPVWMAGAICEGLCAPLGIEPPLYRRRVDFFTKSRAFRIDRARRELGYAPRVGLDEGIRRTLAWYKEQGWL
jgi:nucleoside-diphosphate-sugar epimerase